MKRFGFCKTAAGFFMVLFMVSAAAKAAMVPSFNAKIYDPKDRAKLMFEYKSEVEVSGDVKTFVNTVYDLKGEVLVIEKTVLKDDGKTLVSFEQDQKQLKSVGKIEIREGRANFSLTRDEKTKTDDEKIETGFIVTSTLVAYVQANWESLSKGETLKARLAVLDRLETVGFQFRKDSEKQVNGAPALVLKMKPSSVVISALVSPLFFTFSADGQRLLELEGRTNVKLNVDGKFKDFDGYTVYTYPEATASPPAPVATPVSEPQAKKKK